jgi:pyridoxine kinase
VSDLVTGLDEKGFLKNCDAVLSGYLGDGETGKAIIGAVKKVREASPNALYCCDPVMGDVGRGFYVKPEIPDIFKKDFIPIADIMCPNQFELEALTGMKTKTIDDAIKAINILHDMGPSIILVTSFVEEPGKLNMITSNKKNVFKITTPELQLGGNVAGTGDMTAAVFLSRYLQTGNLEKTLELCTASVFGIIYESCKNPLRKFGKCMELDIIGAQNELVNPTYAFNSVKITP